MGPRNHVGQVVVSAILLVAASSSTLPLCAALASTASHSASRTSLDSTVLKTPVDHHSSSESNFWYAVSRPENVGSGFLPQWPVVPSWDTDGMLPTDCYNTFGQPEFQPKPTCALAVAVDLKTEDTMDWRLIVEGMHQFMDHGLNTFHLGLPNTATATTRKSGRNGSSKGSKSEEVAWLPTSPRQAWGESQIYGMLHKLTPASVMKTCHLVVPITTPPAEVRLNKALFRQAVTQSILRTSSDSIDTLELRYCESSPYHLDAMDYLIDLQREGLVRSISGRGFPTATMRALDGCGFRFDTHQRPFHLLSPDSPSTARATSDLDTPHVLFHPLAGGLLTGRFTGRVFPPLVSEVGRDKSQCMTQTLQSWASRRQQSHNNGHTYVDYLLAWDRYQKEALSPLQALSRKYGVSIASVVLRWTLQTQPQTMGGTIVGCNMVKDPNNKDDCLSGRIRSLRDTFRLELDEGDMEILRQVSGMPIYNPVEFGQEDLDLDGMMKNPKLWL